MKKSVLILMVCLSLRVSGQMAFDFENGTTEGWYFNKPGRWAADTTCSLSGDYSLHHVFDSTIAATDLALFSVKDLCPGCSETLWQFKIRHGTDPSSSNRWHFLLLSDTGPDETTGVNDFNGFAVGVNMTGYDDTLRLWHLSGGKIKKVISSGINWQTDIGTERSITVLVARTPEGVWTLEIIVDDIRYGPWEGVSESLYNIRYAGICYSYTSTRDKMLWLDDVYVEGAFVPDTLPPSVVSVTATSPVDLRIAFNEVPDPVNMTEANLILSGEIEVASVAMERPDLWSLKLSTAMDNSTEYILSVPVLCDLAGNCSEDITYSFIPLYAQTGDIVISEIMADPTPSLELPEKEYIEIYNRTGYTLTTSGWQLITGDDSISLPGFSIAGGGRIILCSVSDTVQFREYGSVIGISSFPAINDGGESLALRDGTSSLIHGVIYSSLLYNDDMRSGGGWSVELTDPLNPFNQPDAWHASSDPSGGTPGRENSFYLAAPDNTCPEVTAIWPAGDNQTALLFNESMMHVMDPARWFCDGKRAVEVISADITDRMFIVKWDDMSENGGLHTVSLPYNASDFAGNVSCMSYLQFGIPYEPSAGDILFNELLFNPLSPGVDYIELYNNSESTVDLSRLFLSGGDDEGNSSNAIRITTLPRQLLPGGYVALTTDREIISAVYPCSDRYAVYEVPRLPSMPDDAGTVMLLDAGMNIIDMVDYDESMHMIFLSGVEGVSLEKAGPGLSSMVRSNWHSASESCNWGTPGAANSVSLPWTDVTEGVTLSSERVSPDGDGFEDVISISIMPGGMENSVSVTIINSRGYVVRRLVSRFYIGAAASFVWDGTADDGSCLPAGLYLIMTEAYNTKGVAKKWKKVCAVLYR